ncbi:MAG: ABC transporter ATP-binding protein [Kineosporiaceae bacterium]|nr:ABC transporter ATP-binding protein [Kineosporiaceae bacterium]
MTAPAPLTVRFDRVSHRIGRRTVLDGIDLTLTERRIGIIGLNGSGKSTLARMVNALVVPTAGRVLVDGLDTARQAAAVRRKVAFVFTDPDAQIVMPTPAEDVAFSLRHQGASPRAAREQALSALAGFGIDHLADSPAHLLSGGEKQLLALASVLVTSPELVVCDEPTTLLDVRNARRIVRLLTEMAPSLVLVTHHLDQLDALERVVVVHEGRVVADDSPAAARRAYLELAEERP